MGFALLAARRTSGRALRDHPLRAVVSAPLAGARKAAAPRHLRSSWNDEGSTLLKAQGGLRAAADSYKAKGLP
jgi:hypothetical protein